MEATSPDNHPIARRIADYIDRSPFPEDVKADLARIGGYIWAILILAKMLFIPLLRNLLYLVAGFIMIKLFVAAAAVIMPFFFSITSFIFSMM